MNLKLYFISLSTLLFYLLALAQEPAGNGRRNELRVDVINPGFELAGPNQQPLSWETTAAEKVRLDRTAARSGESCLVIQHADWDQSVVLSRPVILKIGHLYQLRAWVKSEAGFHESSRPISDTGSRVPEHGIISLYQPFTRGGRHPGLASDYGAVYRHPQKRPNSVTSGVQRKGPGKSMV